MSDAENGLENERKKRATERSKGKMYAFISDHTDSITPHELITKKTRQKRRTLLKIHGIPGQKGLLFVIILLLLRELNIKLFYSNFILFKLTIFYNTIQYTFYNTL